MEVVDVVEDVPEVFDDDDGDDEPKENVSALVFI